MSDRLLARKSMSTGQIQENQENIPNFSIVRSYSHDGKAIEYAPILEILELKGNNAIWRIATKTVFHHLISRSMI